MMYYLPRHPAAILCAIDLTEVQLIFFLLTVVTWLPTIWLLPLHVPDGHFESSQNLAAQPFGFDSLRFLC